MLSAVLYIQGGEAEAAPQGKKYMGGTGGT